MSEAERDPIRLRFYGLGDYASYFQVERALALISEFDSASNYHNLNDVIELHHVALFIENGLTTRGEALIDQDAIRALVPILKRKVGTFFSQLEDSNLPAHINEVDHQYHSDLLDLFARNRVFERCSATVVLEVLRGARIHLGTLLSNSTLVRAYDQETKDLLLASPANAEQLIARDLQLDSRRTITLPLSLTIAERRGLIEQYIDSASPNPNYLQLVANARVDRSTGITASLKLKARRVYDAFWTRHFETNEGMRTGTEVRIIEDQDPEVEASLDGLFATYSYSRQWLAGHLDFPTILNNFIYLFQFSNLHMLLNFPSFYSQLGVFERFMVTAGRSDYRTGIAFNQVEHTAFLQTVMYDNFLRGAGVELEQALQWFVEEYLVEEFGAANLRYRPSSQAATFLERSRHLFSEMESLLKQFSLYAENGELDPELLSMTSEQLVYRDIPSLIQSGKYVYVTDSQDITRIQHLLFSDQSSMGYLGEELHEPTLAELLEGHDVAPGSFQDYQNDDLAFLIDRGILVTNEAGSVTFANRAQFAVLKSFNSFEAASHYHFSPSAQTAIEGMVQKGWVERKDSLLTISESSYFNYMLNQAESSNGPDLRNRYLHGSQAEGDDNRVHFQTYIQALRLMIALVIKINDDFVLADEISNS